MFLSFFIFLFLCFFACLAWRNLVWAIAFLVAFLPSYLIRFTLGPIPFTLLEAMVLILFAAWVIKLKVKNEKLKITVQSSKFKNWRIIILLWLAFATVAMFVAPDLRAAAGVWKAYFIEPILFLIVFASVIKEKKDLELIFYALGFSALYISAFAIYQKFTGIAIPNPIWQAAGTRRVTSFYGYPNAVGLYLAPIVTLYVGWLISRFRILDFKFQIDSKTLIFNLKSLIFQLSVIVSSVLSVIFARSEGAYAGILAGLFFLGLMIKKLRWPTAVITAILILAVLSVPQFKNYVWQQISFQNDSGKVRIIIWKETLEMLKDRPILGAGLSGYQQTFAPYHIAKYIEIYLYPHNIFLNFWSETGLFGLIIFLFIVFQFFKIEFQKLFKNFENLKMDKILHITLMASMITILVHGLVDVSYFKNDLSILFWLIIGVTLASPFHQTSDGVAR